MIVCICNRLNDKTICNSIHKMRDLSAPFTAEDIYSDIGVKPNCGQCAVTIDDMIDDIRHAILMAAE